jgi:hypothetical protein
MSLKGFHILFVIVATLLAFLCGAWAFYFEVEGFFGWFSVSVGSVLLLYCNWFIRKARRIII